MAPPAKKRVVYQGLERLSGYSRQGYRVIFEFGPARLALSVLDEGLIRACYAAESQFLPRRSWAVTAEEQHYPRPDFELIEMPASVELVTTRLRVRIRRQDGGLEWLDASGRMLCQDDPQFGPQFGPAGAALSQKMLPEDEHYYGFGERTSLLDKRGRRYTNWTTDPIDTNADHGPGADALYQAIPFYMALRPVEGGYGLFLNNTFKTVFDVGYTLRDRLQVETTGGELDYYFLYGPAPAAILSQYTALTGRMPLPPRWALGYQQCRWGYYPEAVVRDIAAQFRQRRIPADTIYLDIDYMHDYRVFTWDKDHFPEPAALCQDLAEIGFKLVTIIDPGVKYDPQAGYGVYDQGEQGDYFIRRADGEVFHGYVWPGDSVLPDFVRPEVRQWWGDLHQGLLQSGVRGIWNDMNEPAIAAQPFGSGGLHTEIPGDAPQGPPEEQVTHAETHNLYAQLEAQATYEGWRRWQPERRPFLLTRAGFAGIQQWSAVWTGDNTAVWEHLEMSMPQLCGLSLSGVSYTGVDIGGFFGSSDPELWARWIQLGAFYPLSRGHSINEARQKEPWVWGQEVENIARKYLELRYRCLPYFYSLFEQAAGAGQPIFQPLLYRFWDDPRCLSIHDQVMIGDALMLAPVYHPGQDYRNVYFPPGRWYDFWSGQLITDRNVLAHAPLEVMPVYGRGGSILPLGPVMQYSDERPLNRLTLHIYLDEQGQAEGRLYEDAGDGFGYRQGESCVTYYRVVTSQAGRLVVSARREGSFQVAARTIEALVFGPDGQRTGQLEADQGDWIMEIP